jgi:hypothetical protein
VVNADSGGSFGIGANGSLRISIKNVSKDGRPYRCRRGRIVRMMLRLLGLLMRSGIVALRTQDLLMRSIGEDEEMAYGKKTMIQFGLSCIVSGINMAFGI